MLGMGQLIKPYTPWLGILGPIPILLGATLAALHYAGHGGAGYSFLRQAVSDLGDPSRSAWAWAFNAGMMASGLCMALFVLGTSLRLNSRPAYAIAAIGIVSTLAMAGIGVFTSQDATRTAHYVTAGVAFLSQMVLSASFGLHLPFSRKNALPRWLAIPSLLSALCSFVFLFLLVATRTGRIVESRLGFHLGVHGPLVKPVTVLEWAVLGSGLLLCFATALSQFGEPRVDNCPAPMVISEG